MQEPNPEKRRCIALSSMECESIKNETECEMYKELSCKFLNGVCSTVIFTQECQCTSSCLLNGSAPICGFGTNATVAASCPCPSTKFLSTGELPFHRSCNLGCKKLLVSGLGSSSSMVGNGLYQTTFDVPFGTEDACAYTPLFYKLGIPVGEDSYYIASNAVVAKSGYYIVIFSNGVETGVGSDKFDPTFLAATIEKLSDIFSYSTSQLLTLATEYIATLVYLSHPYENLEDIPRNTPSVSSTLDSLNITCVCDNVDSMTIARIVPGEDFATILLSFGLPAPDFTNSYFTYTYQNLDRSDYSAFLGRQIVRSNTSALTIAGFIPGSLTSLRVEFFETDCVRISNEVVFRLLPALPNSTVSGVVFDNVADSLHFEWSAPSYENQRGNIVRYEVSVVPSSASSTLQPGMGVFRLFNTSTPSISIPNCQPYMDYSVSIAACNLAGCGPVLPASSKTLEGVPEEPPSNFTAVRSDDTNGSILVSWGPPSLPYRNGIIRSYRVEYFFVVDVNTTAAKCALPDSLGDEHKDFDGVQYEGSLTPDRTYSVFVRIACSTRAKDSAPVFGPKSDCVYLQGLASPSSSSAGLSGGAAAAIAIVVVALIGIIVVGFVIYRRRMNRRIALLGGGNFFENAKPYLERLAELEIPRESVELGGSLGEGNFGTVFQATTSGIPNSKGPVKVAIKMLKPSMETGEKVLFVQEAVRMKDLSCPRIVRLLAVCFKTEPNFIALEFMPNGDLKNFLRKCRGSAQTGPLIDAESQLRLALEVCEALAYLEQIKFVHRDIAARNILLDGKYSAKMGDFGLARDIYQAEYYRKTGSAPLPLRWMSAESFMDGVYTTKSDIYMFGVLMWEIFSFANTPWPGRGDQEVIQLVRKGAMMEAPEGCPTCVYRLMKHCWFIDPEDRMSPQELLSNLRAIKPEDLLLVGKGAPSSSHHADKDKPSDVKMVSNLSYPTVEPSLRQSALRNDTTSILEEESKPDRDAFFAFNPSFSNPVLEGGSTGYTRVAPHGPPPGDGYTHVAPRSLPNTVPPTRSEPIPIAPTRFSQPLDAAPSVGQGSLDRHHSPVGPFLTPLDHVSGSPSSLGALPPKKKVRANNYTDDSDEDDGETHL